MLSAATWCVCARTTQVFSVHQGAYCLSPLLPFLERFLSYHQQLDWSAALWRCSWLLWVDTGGSGQNGRGGYWDAKGGRGFWVKGLIDWSSPVHLLCVYQSAWWSQCPSLNNAWLLPPPPPPILGEWVFVMTSEEVNRRPLAVSVIGREGWAALLDADIMFCSYWKW